MRGVSLLPVQADVQLSTRPRVDLLCHDGCPGHMILCTACTLLVSVSGQARCQEWRLFPVGMPWELVINPGYAIMAARLEVEEDEEDEYGVSLEAPTQTSAAITQSPPTLPLTLSICFLPSFCGSLWRAALLLWIIQIASRHRQWIKSLKRRSKRDEEGENRGILPHWHKELRENCEVKSGKSTGWETGIQSEVRKGGEEKESEQESGQRVTWQLGDPWAELVTWLTENAPCCSQKLRRCVKPPPATCLDSFCYIM